MKLLGTLETKPTTRDCSLTRLRSHWRLGPRQSAGAFGELAARSKRWRIAAIQILAALFVLAFCFYASAKEATNAPPPVTARDFYNAGTRWLATNKFADAEKMFQSALAAQDERVQPAALYNLGHARFGEGAEFLKKGPDAQKTAAHGAAILAAGGEAIDSAQSALDGKDVSKMVAAYLKGRGVRRNLRDAEKAVRDAMDTYGNALRKWRRAADDFRGAAELNPADTNAVRNAEIVEQDIAMLVDGLQKMQMMAVQMGNQRQKLGNVLKQLGGLIPAPDMPPGAAGDEDDEDMQPGSLAGQKETGSREGDQMQLPLSPDEAEQILGGLTLDGSRPLPMGDKEGAPPRDKKGRDW
jgi:tetratricopeptide (TPR) repeat protein